MVAVSRSMSGHEIQFLLEHRMASGRYCHVVRTDAILNSSKFLDTDGSPDGKFSSSGLMLLTGERPDGKTTLFGRLLGIQLL
jgi:hypothetical protein